MEIQHAFFQTIRNNKAEQREFIVAIILSLEKQSVSYMLSYASEHMDV
jgi:hypothetical protein